MIARLDPTDLLFSAKGRLARGPFLVTAALLIAAVALYEAVIWPPLHWVTGVFVYPLVFYVGACILSKRLHDRGRTGWWAALVLVAAVAVWPAPYGFFDFLFGLVIVWAVVELGAMPGELGANRFGLAPQRLAHA